MTTIRSITLKVRVGLVVIAVAIATACAAHAPGVKPVFAAEAKRFDIPEGMARVYVYRDKRYAGAALTTNISVGRTDGSLGYGEFMAVNLEPGSYQVSANAGITASKPLIVDADQIYFVEVLMGEVQHKALVERDAEHGKARIAELRMVWSTNMPGEALEEVVEEEVEPPCVMVRGHKLSCSRR